MKFRIVCDIEVSATLAETIRRTGFNLCPDGSGFQVKIPNSPSIPKRKTKVKFFDNPVEEEANDTKN